MASEEETILVSVERGRLGGLGVMGSALFIVGTIAGTGILALPLAIEYMGWVGFLLLTFCTVMSAYTGIILGKAWSMAEILYEDCRGFIPDPYPCLGEKTYGKIGRFLVTSTMNVTMFGGCVVLLLLSAENIQAILKNADVHVSFCYWMFICAAVLLPCTWFGTPKDFWGIALGASLSTAIASVVLVVNMVLDFKKQTTPTRHGEITVQHFFEAFGTLVFGLGGHFAFLTFREDMYRPRDFKWSVIIGYIAVFIMYFPTAFLGYYVYGTELNANVLLTVSNGWMVIVVQILVTLHFICSFVIAINPLSQAVEQLLGIPNTFNWKRCLSRSVTVLLILFVAETVPRFGAVLSLIGGSTYTAQNYIFPTLFYIRISRRLKMMDKGIQDALTSMQFQDAKEEREVPLWMKVFNIEVLGIAIVAGVAATIFAFIDIIEPDSFSLPCYVNTNTSSATG